MVRDYLFPVTVCKRSFHYNSCQLIIQVPNKGYRTRNAILIQNADPKPTNTR